MRTEYKKTVKWVTIEPGEYFASREKIIIATLLGSCISACLWDPIHKISGMNHFLLSSRHYNKNSPICVSEAGRYGIHAMELVINNMLKLGANKRYFKAKVFGGGNVLNISAPTSNFFNVGDVNIRFIKEFLNTEKIPIVASDLGGEFGRIIRFDTNSNNVFVRKIKRVDTTQIKTIEQNYLEKSIKEQDVLESSNNNINLW
ncbi:MAG: chemotaxis protein CheD [Deltaproteobacteria bacterium]|nr:chemotaxis protein CheD [Deltaproteobacteria bacterium]